MKFSEIIYQKAEAELSNRRKNAVRLADMRRKEFIAKNPELLDIEEDMKNAALEVIRSVGADGKHVDVAQIAQRNLAAQKAKKELIKAAGYSEDYLDIPYTCKKCNDTGIYNGKLCECHLKLLQELSVSELTCSPLLARSNFDTFDLNYYSKIKDRETGYSPYEYMRATYGMLKSYAENFTSHSVSLFFSGATGLGKTHLALAILNKLTENGFSVYYNSTGKIIKAMEKERFSRDAESIDDELEKSDLIIVDDLGAEFSTAFSVAAINELVNNTILSGKPIIIISNLSIEELEEKYGQRLTSRLNSFEVISFVGDDIRQIKN